MVAVLFWDSISVDLPCFTTFYVYDPTIPITDLGIKCPIYRCKWPPLSEAFLAILKTFSGLILSYQYSFTTFMLVIPN